MDLNSMLNSGEPPAQSASQGASPTAQRYPLPQAFAAPAGAAAGANGPSASSPSFAAHPAQQITPLHAPPSQHHRSPTASVGFHAKGLTPLQTPTHSQGGQYPFPQHPSQSPVASGPAQQYQSYPPHAVTTPSGRPPSHGFPQQPATPSQYAQPSLQHPQNSLPYNANSHSTTPPSHHSQTPRSVRQSPIPGLQQAPQPQSQYPLQLQHQQSQPSTPLGPPSSVHYQRSTLGSHSDAYSPYHQRNFSGASNGITGGSPAPHHPGAGGFVDSPSAYNRQSPQHMRRTSDYLNQVDRERSVSVSPKTRIPPRIPSQGSRNSSLQESYSTRSSLQHSAPLPQEAQNHVQPSYPGQQSAVAQQSFAHSATDVAQTPLLATPLSQASASAYAIHNPPLSVAAQSHQNQAQKMGLNQLLPPSHSQPTPPIQHAPTTRKQSIDMLVEPAINSSVNAPPQALPQSSSMGSATLPTHDSRADTLLQQPVEMGSRANGNSSQMLVDSRKRPADSQPPAEPPLKRERRRKYTQRPHWAQLHKSNPRYVAAENPAQSQQNGMSRPRQHQQHQHQHQQQQHHHQAARQQLRATPQPTRAVSQQPNGQAKVNGSADTAGWQQDQPLDTDLIHARQILGPWEKSFKWHTPAPDMLKIMQDWLWAKFAANADVGNDPRHGALEIEAKIGTLCEAGTHERMQLPVASMCIINPAFNNKYRFESQMEEPEHKAMNDFLNHTVEETTKSKGRVPMLYKHLYETDTFAPLSPAGYAALPPSARRSHPPGRDLRLRTSRDSRSGRILARIIKVNLGDIHIFNPNAPYDCRVSINLEVNLDRPDLRYEDLVLLDATPALPERKKDRVSYKHLAYSVDLTKVESSGVLPKYELELEVDADVLREQMKRAEAGLDHAYGDVVSGFLDNATFLMRQRPKQ